LKLLVHRFLKVLSQGIVTFPASITFFRKLATDKLMQYFNDVILSHAFSRMLLTVSFDDLGRSILGRPSQDRSSGSREPSSPAATGDATPGGGERQGHSGRDSSAPQPLGQWDMNDSSGRVHWRHGHQGTHLSRRRPQSRGGHRRFAGGWDVRARPGHRRRQWHRLGGPQPVRGTGHCADEGLTGVQMVFFGAHRMHFCFDRAMGEGSMASDRA